jgi:hypothetical protein
MKKLMLLAAVMLAAVVFGVSASSGATTSGVTLLSGQSDLGTTTSVVDPSATTSGSVYSVASDVELDTADTTATLASDGYLCGNAGYHATVKAYDFWGFVVWTYRETFVVYVCHDKVQYKVHLYDEPVDSNFGWSWCGHITNQFTMNPYHASAIGYTKGCFTVLIKGVFQTKYPWASMTIGGNGGLWVRKTGGNT